MIKIKYIIIVLGLIGSTAMAEINFSTNSYGCLFDINGIQSKYLPIEPVVFYVQIKNITNDLVIIADNADFNIVKKITRSSRKVDVTSYGMGELTRNAFRKWSIISLNKDDEYAFYVPLNRFYDLTEAGKYDVSLELSITRLNQGKRTSVKILKTISFSVYPLEPNNRQCFFMDKLISKQIQFFVENIDMQVVEGGQTNYPCFEALKETGVPFNTFSNELQNVDSGSIREKLLHDLGANLYGDIFRLYLEQFEKNK